MPFGKKQPATAPRARMKPPPAEADLAPAVDPATIAKITAWPKHGDAARPEPGLSAEKANLAIALVVRAVLIFIAGGFLLRAFLVHGEIDRLLGLLVFAMIADYGRVLARALRVGAE